MARSPTPTASTSTATTLYPEGWQIGTASADDPIYFALSGNKDTPAIADFHPGLSSDVLYVTNGETTDFAHVNRGTLAWTPELSEGTPGSGFVFPDDEALIQAEFERTLPFDLDVAKSAADPANPVSHLGITTKPFHLKSDDTYKTGLPLANFAFTVSYGDPQEVRVLAKRSLGAVTAKYQINGGPVISKPTSEWNGGDRYGGQSDVYYHVVRSDVTGTQPGDTVKVWFVGGGKTSESFTYQAVEESDDRVLVLVAEDYTGASPGGLAPGPDYLSYYTDALTANGIDFDVYDVDAMGRKAADQLGVLSHYDAVIWYTGDDAITREPGWGPGNASRLAMDEILEARDYLNEGGRLFYTGKFAGHQYALGHGTQLYDPTAANAECHADPAVEARCLPLAGSGDSMNDVLEYWLGAYLLNENAGTNEETGNLHDVLGVADPFTGESWSFNGSDSAQNQDHSASFIPTSAILDPATFPQFTSWSAAKYDRPGGPFDPHTGEHYMYSQIGDVSYKRLTRMISVPSGGATMSPDGERRPDVLADRTTGAWHAASGNSGGWQQWSVDLGAFAGSQVEVSIAYVSDWAVQGLGTFVDDFTVSTGEGTTSFETDADPMDGWTVTGPPPGSSPNPNNFSRITAAGFPEAAVVATPISLYAGFGFEGISDAATRNEVMGRVMKHLLG